jgi:hypothetical protein
MLATSLVPSEQSRDTETHVLVTRASSMGTAHRVDGIDGVPAQASRVWAHMAGWDRTALAWRKALASEPC